MTVDDVRKALQPFVDHDLLRWRGLPDLTAKMLTEAIGEPARIEDASLGAYAAERRTYPLASASGGLAAYVRRNTVVLIEALNPPPAAVLEELGEPSIILPHEILVSGTYVHEYLYSDRGLLLSVAEPFEKQQPSRIVRCRGIRPLTHANELGPELYVAFENQRVWDTTP